MITRSVLNRTLLQRQHLLARVDLPPLELVDHLLGLQAQEVLPPYLSVFARLRSFEPAQLSDALQSRQAVRLLAMRGTIHLLSAQDALLLRPFTQPLLTRLIKSAQWGRDLPPDRYDELAASTRNALAGGPLPVKQLGELLCEALPDHSPSDCGNIAKSLVPLVQVPPRGLWQQSGRQVYETLETWLSSDLREPHPDEIVRRYLRAFGPANPADVTAWSGATGMRRVFASLGDELVRLSDEQGKELWDLADLTLASADEPSPVRLLGRYDNVWLSHAGRDRVTVPHNRKRWMGSNGGVGATVFVDGWLEGTWWQTPSGTVDVALFRSLTTGERSELDTEVAAVEGFLRS